VLSHDQTSFQGNKTGKIASSIPRQPESCSTFSVKLATDQWFL